MTLRLIRLVNLTLLSNRGIFLLPLFLQKNLVPQCGNNQNRVKQQLFVFSFLHAQLETKIAVIIFTN